MGTPPGHWIVNFIKNDEEMYRDDDVLNPEVSIEVAVTKDNSVGCNALVPKLLYMQASYTIRRASQCMLKQQEQACGQNWFYPRGTHTDLL